MPKITQFVEIRGRNIPKLLYSDGTNFLTYISTSCTAPAMTTI
jgi:hypothetical protein